MRKKWSKFKRSVRDSRRQLKLHRKSADADADSDYEDESSDESSDSSSGGADLENQAGGAAYSEEEIIQPPVVTTDAGYFWIGKDYYNTYKAGSKDISDFSRGKHVFFFFFITSKLEFYDTHHLLV